MIDQVDEGLVTTPDDVTEIAIDSVEEDSAPAEDIAIEIEGNDLGIEQPETAELKYVGDLVKLAEAGDKDALLRRASEIEAGFEKVHKDRELVQDAISKVQAFDVALEKVAEGDELAVQELVNLLFERGIDPEVLLGVKPRQVAEAKDDRVSQLEQKLNAMEQEKRDAQWVQANASKLLNAVKPLSNLEYTAEHLLKARQFLPKSGSVTPKNLLVALHQANPELTVGLVTRQPKQATPTMGTSGGASGSNFSGTDLAKLTGEDLRRWYIANKGNL